MNRKKMRRNGSRSGETGKIRNIRTCCKKCTAYSRMGGQQEAYEEAAESSLRNIIASGRKSGRSCCRLKQKQTSPVQKQDALGTR